MNKYIEASNSQIIHTYVYVYITDHTVPAHSYTQQERIKPPLIIHILDISIGETTSVNQLNVWVQCNLMLKASWCIV